ncbi:MAG: hypothetical protein ACJAYB_001510 [Psychromonas sp.]
MRFIYTKRINEVSNDCEGKINTNTKRIKFMISYFKEKIYAQKAAGMTLNSE